MKRDKVITVILVIVIIVLTLGLSYAWYTWISDKNNYKGSSECFDILYIKGTDIGSDQNKQELMPSDSYTGGLSSTVKININSQCDTVNVGGKIYLTTLSSTSSNLYREGLLNYQVLKNNTVTNLKGNITSDGDIVIDIGLLSHNTKASDSYTVYVWIDNNLVENSDAGTNYYGKISAEAYQIEE